MRQDNARPARATPKARYTRRQRATPKAHYSSLARFYAADARRVRSRERDIGLWWRDDVGGPLHPHVARTHLPRRAHHRALG